MNPTTGVINGTAIDGTFWGCALDYKGLYWEVKTNASGLRYTHNTYAWGGKTAVGRTSTVATKGTYSDDWNPLVDAANGTTNGTTPLCGFTDWRAPLASEIISILDLSASTNPVIFDSNTLNYRQDSYWIANPANNNNANALKASHLSMPEIIDAGRNIKLPLRLVRGGTHSISDIESAYIFNEWPNNRYTDHTDGTVTDKITRLMWKQCSEGRTTTTTKCDTGTATRYIWDAANNTTTGPAAIINTGAGYADYTDWRLPTAKELFSLVSQDKSNPLINSTIFPNTDSVPYWTSTVDAVNTTRAWAASFNTGYCQIFFKTDNNPVRLVRTVQ